MKSLLNNTALNLGLAATLLTTTLLPTVAIAQPSESPTPITQTRTNQKKRIAVATFTANGFTEDHSPSESQFMTNLITKQLVRSGQYEVIERSRLDQVMKEQISSNADFADPATAIKLGQLLSVDALLIGNVTQFNIDSKETEHSILIGTKRTKVSTATVELDGRLVSTKTGLILNSYDGMGKETSKQSCLITPFVSSCTFQDNANQVLRDASSTAITQMVTAINKDAATIPSAVPAEIRSINQDATKVPVSTPSVPRSTKEN